MTMTCQVCGTTNPDGTTYCEGCGVELTAAAAAPAAEPTTPAAPSDPAVDAALPVDAAPAAPTPTDPASGDAAVATVTDAPAPADASVLTPELTTPELAAPVDTASAPADQTASEPAPTPETAPVAVPASPVPTSAAPTAPAPAAPDAGTAPAARLGVKKYGAATGDFIPLQGTRLVVGRFDASSGPVDIDLSGLGGQEHISRRHAELYAEGGTWMVRDLGSTNGVYIKRAGESAFSPRLQEPAALHDGDELAFGNLMLSFHQG